VCAEIGLHETKEEVHRSSRDVISQARRTGIFAGIKPSGIRIVREALLGGIQDG
jgi:hypothetical protein